MGDCKKLGEFDLIYKYFAPLASSFESFGLKDDAAVFDSLGNKIVVSVDTIIENHHFFSGDEPESVATKLLETNLSDIASMGATPKYWTLALSIPKNKGLSEDWLVRFCHSLEKIQKQHDFYLLGGDTTACSGELTLSVNIFGFLAEGKSPMHKFGAKVGDVICVSNFIGDSYWGFKILEKSPDYKFLNDLSKEDKDYLVNAYKYPKAQVELGKILVDFANACTDISDGLWADLEKLCVFSGKLGLLHLSKLQFSSSISQIVALDNLSSEEVYLQSVTGGGDYQLIFTLPREKLDKLYAVLGSKFMIQEIGEIIDDREGKLKVFNSDNHEITTKNKGFEHKY